MSILRMLLLLETEHQWYQLLLCQDWDYLKQNLCQHPGQHSHHWCQVHINASISVRYLLATSPLVSSGTYQQHHHWYHQVPMSDITTGVRYLVATSLLASGTVPTSYITIGVRYTIVTSPLVSGTQQQHNYWCQLPTSYITIGVRYTLVTSPLVSGTSYHLHYQCQVQATTFTICVRYKLPPSLLVRVE